MMGEILAFTRCLLDSRVPGVAVDTDRTYSQCKDFDQEWGDWARTKGERKAALDRMILKARRKKSIYDSSMEV